MRKLSVALFCLTAVGCGRDFTQALNGLDPQGEEDASTGDFGPRDGGFSDGPILFDGPPDFGPRDFGPRDRGFPPRDIGPTDRGFPDRNPPDFGPGDAFIPDRGFPDRGFPDRPDLDGGPPDLGDPDLGFPDGGPRDMGRPDFGPMGCQSDPDCAGLNTPCQQGRCVPGPQGINICVGQIFPNGTMCDDSLFCTLGDQCFQGQCRGGTPRPCPTTGVQCQVNFCNENLDQCTQGPAPDGSACSDANLCTSEQCLGGMCVPTMTPLNGDTCAMPIAIPEVVGQRTEVGDTSCFANASQGSCGGNSAPETVYSLTTSGHRRLLAQTSPGPMGNNFDTVMYVNTGCGMLASEVTCDDDMGTGSFSRIESVLPPGQHFIHVDGFTTQSGGYALALDIDPQNTCSGVVDIPVPAANQTRTVLGTTAGAANTFTSGGCASGARSPDHVYRFVVATPTRLIFETSDPAPLQRFDTALHIRNSCAAGPPSLSSVEIACDDDMGQGTFSRIDRSFMPGTYFLVVDGFSSNRSGDYRLTVTNAAGPTSIVFPATGDSRTQQIPGVFSRQGDFVEAVHDIPTLSQVTGFANNLVITNNLTCAGIVFRVRINNTDVGTMFVSPGEALKQDSFTFPPIMGPRYNVRYEVQSDVPAPCGGVDLPNDISTVALSP